MKTFDEKVLRKMDFPKVVGILSGYTLSELGKERALQLKPSITLEEITRLQNETEDAVKINRRTSGIPLARFENIHPHLKRINIGASLNGLEIAQIGRVLTNAKEITRFFDELKEREIELHELYQLADQFAVLPELERKIKQVVEEDGRVKEGASPALRSIRNGMKQSEQRIREKLENMIRGRSATYLTDTIITMRNDRYVLPVKQENRNHFGGIVHDQSSTGQTVFVEPQVVLELNNKLKQLQMDEKNEIQRILAELSNEIAPHTAHLATNTEVMATLDFIQAKGRYARDVEAVRPLVSQEKEVDLIQAKHPLLPADEVVANDIKIGQDYRTMVITGPNTGGKTVVLKTFGLLQAMGQAGLQIPAEEGSQIGIYTQMFADIGDEQSMEQNLSTFSSHMTTIISLLDRMDENSLILLDELGAGTDPQEGAALAIAILDAIAAVGSDVVVTSHYPELKAYGYNRPQTVNASMEFNVDTLSPTYRLLIGVPGRSNAFEIARRLGLSEDIIQTSKQLMSGESQSVEEMIADLEIKRKQAEVSQKYYQDESNKANQLQKEMSQAREEWQQREADREKKAEEKANQIIEKAEKEASKIIDDLRQKQLQAGQVVKEHELIDAKSRLSSLKTMQEENALQSNKLLQKAKKKAKRQQILQVGDTVHVSTLGQRGTLVEKVSDKEWVVQMGSLKMKLPVQALEKTGDNQEKEPKRVRTVRGSSTVPTEVDLRGMRVEEALMKMDQYMDKAMLANYPKVTIIHGVGTGAVRKGVQEALKRYSFVKQFQIAPANQGGAGATIVEFK